MYNLHKKIITQNIIKRYSNTIHIYYIFWPRKLLNIIIYNSYHNQMATISISLAMHMGLEHVERGLVFILSVL